MEQVVLVDNEDNELGVEEKFACHKLPVKLHRAFSVFVLNDKDQLLITKRSTLKKTWPGFWSNTCCSHPRANEDAGEAAKRRLEEELGFSCDLTFLFKFQYEAAYDNEWGEHELDHVFVGYYDGPINANKDEIEEINFVNLDELAADMAKNPDNYTPWLRTCFKRFLYHIGKT